MSHCDPDPDPQFKPGEGPAATIALAGNPNCGKTTMFNALTGSSQYVGNWPGVTVEKKTGRLRHQKEVLICDLPGIYSLSPYTLEEVISRDYLISDQPDAVINLVDGTNLERNLYLTTQVLELGLPVVIALNMYDVIEKSEDSIDLAKLGAGLGAEVLPTSALKGTGLTACAKRALAVARTTSAPKHIFEPEIEAVLDQIAARFQQLIAPDRQRWHTVKLFERDGKVLEELALDDSQRADLEKLIAPLEEQLDCDSETLITNGRYDFIAALIDECLTRGQVRLSTSDRIDRVVTNRILALPIFAAVMFLMYYLSVSTIGSMGTNWVNDTLFGNWITSGATSVLHSLHVAPWMLSLIVDGIINGVGTVLGFVPQMLVLFFCLSLLEDSGYMARVAFIMDRVFRKFGLSGKSFIPILVGTGCGVPAIMATRTIENEKDRRMTIMLTTFMPCTAKTVIIAMITLTFFPHSVWIAPSMYFLGIAVIVLSGIGLKKTAYFGGEPAPFVMELPAYRIPSLRGVLIHMWERSRMFVIKAGTIIFSVCVIVWFFSTFNYQLQMVPIQHSMLAGFGHTVTWLFAPVGFADWKATVATITALMAKESGISTLAVLNGVSDPDHTQAVMHGIAGMFTAMGAFSFMILNLFDPPCIVAMSTTNREMNSRKWTSYAIGYQLLLGYGMALITYQLGSYLFYGAAFGVGQVAALAMVALIVFMLLRRPSRAASALDPAAAAAAAAGAEVAS